MTDQAIITPRRHRIALPIVSQRHARSALVQPGQETFELPFKLLFVGDYTARPDPRPLEDRRPARVRADNFDAVKAQWKPAGAEVLWAELRETVLAIGAAADVQVEILNCSKEDLLADFEDAPEIPKSGLYKIAYSSEFGSFGGTPIGALIAHYDFGRLGPQDRALLTQIARAVAPAHVPFFNTGEAAVALADPALLDGAPKWREFLATEDARYLRLGAPSQIGAHLAASFAELGFCAGAPGLDEEAARLFVGARTAAAIKTLHRAFIGVWKTPEAIEEELGAFLAAHVSPDGPFLEARIHLDRAREEPGWHRFELVLRPNREPPGEPVTIRIGGKLDKE